MRWSNKPKVWAVGERFGQLSYVGPSAEMGKAVFLCDCGTEKAIYQGNVSSGDTVSCGCQKREQMGDLRRSHGQSDTPLYQCWKDMKNRSTAGSRFQQEKPTYVGVGRDPRWDSFEAFEQDMGEAYFSEACLARYGDQGDYSKENSRWTTKSENSLERWHA